MQFKARARFVTKLYGHTARKQTSEATKKCADCVSHNISNKYTMPTIHEKIREEVKEAMRARDTMRLYVVRGILSSFVNELIAQKKKPNEVLPDTDALKVIKPLANQRKDSIEQFTKGFREDLAKIEEEELVLLQKNLPETMSKSDIKKVAEKKQKELGFTDKASMGKLMGAVMKELKDKADGGDVKDVVEKSEEHTSELQS